jgi:hypothetical protein
MFFLVTPGRAYDPATIAVMVAAFDMACHSLAKLIDGNDHLRRTLALAILRNVNQGERDAVRISELASSELVGLTVHDQKIIPLFLDRKSLARSSQRLSP